MPQNSHDMGVSLSSRSFCRLRSTFCLANGLRHSLLLFQSPSCLRHGIMKEDLTSLGVSFRFSINIPLIFLVSFSSLEIIGHVCSPSEKPFCFSCLSVCIVVQGKGHNHFLLRRFGMWRCPLYFYWLVYGWALHTLYERGILRFCIWKTLDNLRTI